MRAYDEKYDYWLTNKAWLTEDEDGNTCLKESAPEKARKSYEAFKRREKEEREEDERIGVITNR